MARTTDLYAILGVARDASAEEIRKAYRRLARELHPDLNPSPEAEARFKEVAGAYEILSDPEKRARYDTYGQASGAAGYPFTDIQDIFDMFFGGGSPFGTTTRRRRRTGPERGEDVRADIRLSFEESVFGATREVEVERSITCPRCLGNGSEPGSAPIACRTCGGVGDVQEYRRSIFGTIMTSSTCRTCRGSGIEVVDPCEECFGAGRARRVETVTVDVPAGVADGMDIRVRGRGSEGRLGGAAGDLYVGIQVAPSEAFERRGTDLVTVLEVPLTLAALGGEVELDTLDGPERIRIQPGAQSGTVMRLRAKGVPNLNRRGRGDLYVTVHVATPRDPSREERELLERLAELRGERTSKREPLKGELRRPDA
jgi:molecular chaperone DnaJ